MPALRSRGKARITDSRACALRGRQFFPHCPNFLHGGGDIIGNFPFFQQRPSGKAGLLQQRKKLRPRITLLDTQIVNVNRRNPILESQKICLSALCLRHPLTFPSIHGLITYRTQKQSGGHMSNACLCSMIKTYAHLNTVQALTFCAMP